MDRPDLRVTLPIDERVAEIVTALERSRALVLVAEPGAGKTTRVPPALLEARAIGGDGEIVVLEPRRLAARMAARRVAEELGERAGDRVGYQLRFEDVTSERTRIRFVTEAILTRRLTSDPDLGGVSVVVLDEFHERHLHGDVALALLKRLQESTRRDLRVVVMSATLDAAPVARFLDCDVLTAAGRRFDVEIEHLERADDRPLEAQVAAAVRRLVVRGLDGDVLVFLPGAAEIRRARDAIDEVARGHDLLVLALHGDLPPAEQDRAVRPADRRKIILSTNVAESSITIDGVVAVVDSGLARVAGHSPWTGLPTLATSKISQASAAQRAGRAGRTRSGRCLRLYTKADHDTRPPHDVPEVKRADLAETALALHASGERDLAAFPWFESPPRAALDAADELLRRLGAVDSTGTATEVGRRMLALPVHPRLARLVMEADARGEGARGCLLAALVSEREIRRASRTRIDAGAQRGTDEVGASDLVARMEQIEAVEADGLRADAMRWHDLDAASVRAVIRARDQLARRLGHGRARGRAPRAETGEHEAFEALLVATLTAFPDRVGRRRAPRAPDVVFAGGGSGKLADTSVVREAELLVAVDADAKRGSGVVVRLASEIQPEWLLELYPDRIVERREVRFDRGTERVDVVSSIAYDALVLDESRSASDADAAEITRVLVEAALEAGIGAFCDADALELLRARVELVATHAPDAGLMPIDDAAVREALVALCEGMRSFAELRDAGVLEAIRAGLPPRALAALDVLAPEHIVLARGRRAAVHYERGKPPWLASRIQDFFGMREGPRVAAGRVPLVLHLLAPSQRPVQVTTDLAGFWERHYPDIRRTLMRRYPKHAWPEDPLAPR